MNKSIIPTGGVAVVEESLTINVSRDIRNLKGRSKPLERALLSLSDDSFASFRLRRQTTGLIFGSFPTGGPRRLSLSNASHCLRSGVDSLYDPDKKQNHP